MSKGEWGVAADEPDVAVILADDPGYDNTAWIDRGDLPCSAR